MVLLLAVLLPKVNTGLQWTLDVLNYRQQRNFSAYRSHRRRRLERLRTNPGRGGEKILELSL